MVTDLNLFKGHKCIAGNDHIYIRVSDWDWEPVSLCYLAVVANAHMVTAKLMSIISLVSPWNIDK